MRPTMKLDRRANRCRFVLESLEPRIAPDGSGTADVAPPTTPPVDPPTDPLPIPPSGPVVPA